MNEIPAVLTCDVGNSRLRIARICGDDASPVQALPTAELSSLPEALASLWGEDPTPKSLAATSVNPAGLEALQAAAQQALNLDVAVVGRDLPLPIETDLPHPDAIGTDRLCCAAAAYDRLGTGCVIADFGTAVTIDCVNDEGVLLGGAILPGLRMSAECLSASTAQLPAVEPIEPDWVFGKDTHQAIVGGLVRGARGALRELVEAYATELGRWPIVIATGGDAELVCGQGGASELVQAVVPELSLRGVAMAYYRSLLR